MEKWSGDLQGLTPQAKTPPYAYAGQSDLSRWTCSVGFVSFRFVSMHADVWDPSSDGRNCFCRQRRERSIGHSPPFTGKARSRKKRSHLLERPQLDSALSPQLEETRKLQNADLLRDVLFSVFRKKLVEVKRKIVGHLPPTKIGGRMLMACSKEELGRDGKLLKLLVFEVIESKDGGNSTYNVV